MNPTKLLTEITLLPSGSCAEHEAQFGEADPSWPVGLVLRPQFSITGILTSLCNTMNDITTDIAKHPMEKCNLQHLEIKDQFLAVSALLVAALAVSVETRAGP